MFIVFVNPVFGATACLTERLAPPSGVARKDWSTGCWSAGRLLLPRFCWPKKIQNKSAALLVLSDNLQCLHLYCRRYYIMSIDYSLTSNRYFFNYRCQKARMLNSYLVPFKILEPRRLIFNWNMENFCYMKPEKLVHWNMETLIVIHLEPKKLMLFSKNLEPY